MKRQLNITPFLFQTPVAASIKIFRKESLNRSLQPNQKAKALVWGCLLPNGSCLSTTAVFGQPTIQKAVQLLPPRCLNKTSRTFNNDFLNYSLLFLLLASQKPQATTSVVFYFCASPILLYIFRMNNLLEYNKSCCELLLLLV